MIPNTLLSIAIPTYNRSDMLRENLITMLPQLIKHRIPLYISDDSSDECTRIMAEELRTEHPLLVYRKNEARLGHDANFFATLAMPDTEYVWYLGDSRYFAPGALDEVMAALVRFNPDFCFLNTSLSGGGTRLIEGDTLHPFLLDRTWYLTLSGATIYGRTSRKSYSLQAPKSRLTDWKNFPQLGLILETCSQSHQRLLWLEPTMLKANQQKSSYWLKSAFSVFVKDWSKLIRSFPVLFNEMEQNRILRSHSINSGLFGFISLIHLRAIGALTVEELERYHRDFAIVSPISTIWANLLARLPQRLIVLLWWVVRFVRNLVRGKV